MKKLAISYFLDFLYQLLLIKISGLRVKTYRSQKVETVIFSNCELAWEVIHITYDTVFNRSISLVDVDWERCSSVNKYYWKHKLLLNIFCWKQWWQLIMAEANSRPKSADGQGKYRKKLILLTFDIEIHLVIRTIWIAIYCRDSKYRMVSLAVVRINHTV
jgi:hypothetical protein